MAKSAKSVVSAVTGFLSKHIVDLLSVSDAVSELVQVAPLDHQDKERISEVISQLRQSAAGIEKYLKNTNLTEGAGVTLKQSDILKALDDYFKSDAGKKALSDAAK